MSVIVNNMERELAALKARITELEKPCVRQLQTEDALFKKNLANSEIVKCIINDQKLYVYDYKKVLLHIYGLTTKEIILQQTILNLTEEPKFEKGFKYYKSIGLSVQGADTRRTLKEIFNIARAANILVDLTIKLESGEVVCYEK